MQAHPKTNLTSDRLIVADLARLLHYSLTDRALQQIRKQTWAVM